MGFPLQHCRSLNLTAVRLYAHGGTVYVESYGKWCWIKLQLSKRVGIQWLGDYRFDVVIETARKVHKAYSSDRISKRTVRALNQGIQTFNQGREESRRIEELKESGGETKVLWDLSEQVHKSALETKKGKNRELKEKEKALQQEKEALEKRLCEKDQELARLRLIAQPICMPWNGEKKELPLELVPEEVLSTMVEYTIEVAQVEEVVFDAGKGVLQINSAHQKRLEEVEFFKTMFEWNGKYTGRFDDTLALVDNMNLWLDIGRRQETAGSIDEIYVKWKMKTRLSKDCVALSFIESAVIQQGLERVIRNIHAACMIKSDRLKDIWERLLGQTLPLNADNLKLIPLITEQANVFELHCITQLVLNYLIDNIHSPRVASFIEHGKFILKIPSFGFAPLAEIKCHFSEINTKYKLHFIPILSKIETESIFVCLKSKEGVSGLHDLLSEETALFNNRIRKIEIGSWDEKIDLDSLLKLFPNLTTIQLGPAALWLAKSRAEGESPTLIEILNQNGFSATAENRRLFVRTLA